MTATTVTALVEALGAAIEGASRADGEQWRAPAGVEPDAELSAADIHRTFSIDHRDAIRSLRWTGLTGLDLVEAPVTVLLHSVAVGDARKEEAAALDDARAVAHAIEVLSSPGLEFVTVESTHLERDGDDLVARLAVILRFFAAVP